MADDNFWRVEASRINWTRPFTQIQNSRFHTPVSIRWFEDGELNVCYNCVDRHLPQHAERVAFYFEPDDPQSERQVITYSKLYQEVCRFSKALLDLGVERGDRVTIYLPMIPEAAYAMLACARIGAVHSVVFGGFSPESLSHRIEDCDSHYVITADEGLRGGKKIPLKANVDRALLSSPRVKKVVVVARTGALVPMTAQRDFFYHDLVADQFTPVDPVAVNAEDPFFILYTSGSTNKPKGVLHTSGGYLVYAHSTFRRVFDYQKTDVFWCTADVGWITGHSYMIYGPLSNGATSVLFEGIPSHPDFGRFWEVVERYQVSIFYTAPTAIRALMREGDHHVLKHRRNSLRVLGTVGEPINPEVWRWYHRVVGEGRCPVVDTWWQTETGGIMISPLPGNKILKPGSASEPLAGIAAEIVSPEGKVLEGVAEGLLVLADSWPGQARTVYRDHQRFEETYFNAFPGKYFTGDGCRRDEDGFYWITGRVDDVLNVSGHRLGTAELESAIVALPEVSEAAVVGMPHDLKGQGIYAYVCLKAGVAASDELRQKVKAIVVDKVSAIARPDVVQWATGLPKTRSGKIMRRILRKIAEGHITDLGDVSTLADPSVVQDLARDAQNLRNLP